MTSQPLKTPALSLAHGAPGRLVGRTRRHSGDSSTIGFSWRGTIARSEQGGEPFAANALHVAGPRCVAELVPMAVALTGRTDLAKLNKYLGDLRASTTRVRCVLRLEPADGAAAEQYGRLYGYLSKRRRAGIARAAQSDPSAAAPEEVYVVPLDDVTLPPGFLLLDTSLDLRTLQLGMPRHVLLLVVVARLAVVKVLQGYRHTISNLKAPGAPPSAAAATGGDSDDADVARSLSSLSTSPLAGDAPAAAAALPLSDTEQQQQQQEGGRQRAPSPAAAAAAAAAGGSGSDERNDNRAAQRSRAAPTGQRAEQAEAAEATPLIRRSGGLGEGRRCCAVQ
eukprot:m51a1_g7088 hypothetical protein (337) ;mRNA; r:22573-23896